MSEFLLFLGRLHVLALHLPIGMLLLTLVIDVMGRRASHSQLLPALPFCWGATAASSVLTVVLGLMHIQESGFDGDSAHAHRAFGMSVAITSVAIWCLLMLRPVLYRRTRFFTSALMLFLIIMTGHYGGNLTHGESYLTEFAPAPLRTLLGLPMKRPAPTSLAAVNPWQDVINPLLQAHCIDCHNADKHRGKLNLSTLAGLQAGGKSGAVVIAGDAANSDLFRRISLPATHDDFMPAEGKTPLRAEQVRLIQWWIDAGMPVDKTMTGLTVDPAVTNLIASELHMATASSQAAADTYPKLAPATLQSLSALGWLLRPQAQDSNALLVSLAAPGHTVTDEMLKALGEAKNAIVELNLRQAGLSDMTLKALGNMPALEVLQLGDNILTDASMATLNSYSKLRVLNLYGNAGITDKGLLQLRSMSQLQSVYIGATTATSAGIATLQATLPSLKIYNGIIKLNR